MGLTINGREYLRYEIIELDVWGNKRDGFDLNNLFHTGVYITLPADWTDKQLVRELKQLGFIKRNVRHSSIEIEIFNEGQMLCIGDSRTGRPIYQLHAV